MPWHPTHAPFTHTFMSNMLVKPPRYVAHATLPPPPHSQLPPGQDPTHPSPSCRATNCAGLLSQLYVHTAPTPVFDIIISTVFCFLLLLAAERLNPGSGHRRSWKAFEGPQNCRQAHVNNSTSSRSRVQWLNDVRSRGCVPGCHVAVDLCATHTSHPIAGCWLPLNQTRLQDTHHAPSTCPYAACCQAAQHNVDRRPAA